MTIGPIVPHEDVHFVVIGCHLVHGSRMDIRGSAWFDDLWMGELPLFALESNFQTHFRERDSRVVITSHVDGLDPKHSYRLDMQMVDAEGTTGRLDVVRSASDPVHSPGRRTAADAIGGRPAHEGKADRLDAQSAAARLLRSRSGPQPRHEADPHQADLVCRDGLALRRRPTRGSSAGRSSGPRT